MGTVITPETRVAGTVQVLSTTKSRFPQACRTYASKQVAQWVGF